MKLGVLIGRFFMIAAMLMINGSHFLHNDTHCDQISNFDETASSVSNNEDCLACDLLHQKAPTPSTQICLTVYPQLNFLYQELVQDSFVHERHTEFLLRGPPAA